MGCFYIINTFMKTFTQFIKEMNVTHETQRAIDKFGSRGSFTKIGRNKIGHQSLPGSRKRPTK